MKIFKKISTKIDRWTIVHLVILLAAIIIESFLLSQSEFNTYYASTVKSMSQSWHNFFFASYDPGGFVSVDKPPLGFWIQTLFTQVFGFHSWSLVLPQIIAHVLSIEILYQIVKKYHGQKSALLSALIFTLTPISAILAGTNHPDTLLTLFILIASGLFLKSISDNKFKFAIYGAIIIGLGFNIKGAQALMVVPAIFLTLFIASKAQSIGRRAMSLALIGGIICIIGLSWSVVIENINPVNRPYTGSTSDNSPVNLAIGYNASQRLLGQRATNKESNKKIESDQNKVFSGTGTFFYGGQASITRLWNNPLGRQASWFIIIALIGGFAIITKRQLIFPLSNEQLSGLYWIFWLVPCMALLSFMQFMHPYYSAIIAPPVAALSGAGLIAMVKSAQERGWKSYLLAIALFFTSISYWVILSNSSAPKSLQLVYISLSILILIYIFVKIAKFENKVERIARIAIYPIIALLVAMPLFWIIQSYQVKIDGIFPQADSSETKIYLNRSFKLDKKLLEKIKAPQNTSKFAVATESSNFADQIIIKTGLPVMNMGGFYGTDPILTLDSLKEKVKSEDVRYFLLSNYWKEGEYNFEKTIWIKDTCKLIESYSSDKLFLYDCRKSVDQN